MAPSNGEVRQDQDPKLFAMLSSTYRIIFLAMKLARDSRSLPSHIHHPTPAMKPLRRE